MKRTFLKHQCWIMFDKTFGTLDGLKETACCTWSQLIYHFRFDGSRQIQIANLRLHNAAQYDHGTTTVRGMALTRPRSPRAPSVL